MMKLCCQRLLTSVVLMANFGLVAQSEILQTDKPPSPPQPSVILAPNHPVQREIARGEAHAYEIKLKKGQFVQITAEQKGIDVEIKLRDSNETVLIELNRSNSIEGAEPFAWIPEQDGVYRFEVRAAKESSKRGTYVVRLNPLRKTSPADQGLVQAEMLYAKGKRLQSKRDKAALLEAIQNYSQSIAAAQKSEDQFGQAKANESLGEVLYGLSEFQKALQAFQDALKFYRAIGDRRGEADSLNSLGVVFYRLGNPQKTLGYYEQSLSLWRQMADQRGEAITLVNIGGHCLSVGDTQKGVEYLQLAVPLAHSVEEFVLEIAALNSLGAGQRLLGNTKKALEFYQLALERKKTRPPDPQMGVILNNIGELYLVTGEKLKALEYFQEALALQTSFGNRTGQALVFNNLGQTYKSIGELAKAVEVYTKALEIGVETGSRPKQAVSLTNLGVTYLELGESEKAQAYYEQALSLSRAISDKGLEASILTNLGVVCRDRNEFQKAFDYYRQSLVLNQETGDTLSQGTAWDNLGGIYNQLGDVQKSFECYDRALRLHIASQNRSAQARTYHNRSVSLSEQGNLTQAVESLEQALKIWMEVSDRSGQAQTLAQLGVIYLKSGDFQLALDYLSRALAIQEELQFRSAQTVTIEFLAEVWMGLGDRQKARHYLTQTLELQKATQRYTHRPRAFYHLAKLERQEGNLLRSKAAIEQAIELIESVRTQVKSQELRTSYFANGRIYYEFYLDLLYQLHQSQPDQGYDRLALHIAEKSRARSLVELLTESQVELAQGVEASLLQRERKVKAHLTDKLAALSELLSRDHTENQKNLMEKETEQLTEEHRQVLAEIRAQSPQYAALTQPKPITPEEIQNQVLDQDTLLLEYAFGEERGYVFVVTPTDLRMIALSKPIEIEKLARQVHHLYKSSPKSRNLISKTPLPVTEEANPQSPAELSRLILDPVKAYLGNKRVLIAPDGPLYYVSFAALPMVQDSGSKTEPAQFLIERHELVTISSASTLMVLRKETRTAAPPDSLLALLADPVFTDDDIRIKNLQSKEPKPSTEMPSTTEKSDRETDLLRSNDGLLTRESRLQRIALNRLPFTRQEADEISHLILPTQTLKALDFGANRSFLVNPKLSHYRFLHIATHGLLNTEHPELSALALSFFNDKGERQDGFFRAMEVYNLKLNAELVVLSACETGLGKEIQGEGLIGLTRGFMYAGAPRVIVSLWSVSDAATSQLMVAMYKAMLKQGKRPAAALREAQLMMIRNRRFRAPYYWAAFQQQGEYR